MEDILKKAKPERDSALRQKAKINWLTMGDENTKYFHQSIKQRHRANTINVLHKGDEITTDQARIQGIFQAYYRNLLCNDIETKRPINMNVIQRGPISRRPSTTSCRSPSPLMKSRKLCRAFLNKKLLVLMASTVVFTKQHSRWLELM